jgi:hypothetical protein
VVARVGNGAEPASYIDHARLEALRKRLPSDPDVGYALDKLYLLEAVAKARQRDLEAARAECNRDRANDRSQVQKLIEWREQGIAIAGIVELIDRWRSEAKRPGHKWRDALRCCASEAAVVLRKGAFPLELRRLTPTTVPLSPDSQSASR